MNLAADFETVQRNSADKQMVIQNLTSQVLESHSVGVGKTKGLAQRLRPVVFQVSKEMD